MAKSTPDQVRRRRQDLLRRISRAPDGEGVFAEASRALRQLVPFDAIAWVATDPATGLPTRPMWSEGLDHLTPGLCSDHWEREFLVPDVNLFRHLARADVPAAGLRVSTDNPGSSPRYKMFLGALDFDDELRAVCRAGATPWAIVTLWRRGETSFTSQETDVVAGLSRPIAEALRVRAVLTDSTDLPPTPQTPGLVVLDAQGEVISVNQRARQWLAVLPDDPRLPNGSGVPLWLSVLAHRTRSNDSHEPAQTRVRTQRGAWLTCHASTLDKPDGTPTETAVVIQAARPVEVVPIAFEAYDLTERERQIVALIARGLNTGSIADRLFVSSHTVRDHVKAVLGKVGVSSRGELVARLFAEAYDPTDGLH